MVRTKKAETLKDLEAKTRNRIAQLIPTLSSPVAGEVSATVGAIGRVLKAAGNDWHDLAGALAKVPAFGERTQATVNRPPPPKPKGRSFKGKMDGVLSPELRDVITGIIGRNGDPFELLGDYAGGFIEGLIIRCSKNDIVRITVKQDRFLRNLARAAGAVIPWDEIK